MSYTSLKLYGCETCTVNVETTQTLRVIQRTMKIRGFGVIRRAKKTNERIQSKKINYKGIQTGIFELQIKTSYTPFV